MNELQARKAEIDADLQRMTQRWRQEWDVGYTPVTLTMLDTLIDFLNRGGKRVRGSLAMESYYLHGGADKVAALGAARVVELIQAYLLIMDDIQDRSKLRRGGPAVHVQLAALHDGHYGVAQAMNVAMLASHRALDELMALPVPDSVKARTARLLSHDISVTIVGQINDLYNQIAAETITEKEIIKTLTWKTAYYTFISPMELGACLAGSERLSDRLRTYAVNAGIAFQIHDDISGVFGDKKELGKSTNDDIREGKATLLAVYARRNSTPAQQSILIKTLGNSQATAQECDNIRQIFDNVGARRYASEQVQKYINAAELVLDANAENSLLHLVRVMK